MKYHYLLLMACAAGALASCSSDNDDKIVKTHDAITFAASVPKPNTGRAVTTVETLTSFKTYGFVDKQIYMDGVDVNRNGTRWEYAPVQYWPAGKSVNFYSYSPKEINSGAAEGNITSDNPDIPDFINDGKTDLLYAVNMDQNESTGQVKVNFRHALSQVRFMVKKNTAQPVNVKVYSLEVINANTVGSFRFPRQTTAQGTDVYGTWHDMKSPAVCEIYLSEDGMDLTAEAQEMLSTGYMFVVPQTLTELTGTDTSKATIARLRCTITDSGAAGHVVWPSSTAEPGYDASNTSAYIYFPLYTQNNSEWISGKSYRYQLTVGVPSTAGAIDFDVTVDDYVDFSDVPEQQ